MSVPRRDDVQPLIGLSLAILASGPDAGERAPTAGETWRAVRDVIARMDPASRDDLGPRFSVDVATIVRDRGRPDVAIGILESEHAELATGSPLRPFVLADLADLYRVAGRWNEARATLRAADDAVSGGRVDPRASFRVLNVRTMLELTLGLVDRAFATAEEAYRIADRLGDAFGERSTATWQRATLALGTDDYAYARDVLESALADDTIDGALRGRMRVQLGVAIAELGRSDPELAREADEILRAVLAEGTLDRYSRFIALRFRADLARARGALDDAAILLADARVEVASAQSPGTSLLAPPDAAFVTALEASIARGRTVEAGDLRTLLDRLRDDYARFLDQWRTVPYEPGGIGFLHFNERRRVLSELIALTLATEPEASAAGDALAAVFAAQELGSLARTLTAGTGSLDDVRRLVPPDGVMLIYVPGPLATHLFVVEPSNLQVFTLAGRDSLEDDLRRFVASVIRFPGVDRESVSASRRAVARLGRTVVGRLFPVAVRDTLSRKRRLTIVGSDLLCHLPFECLPFGDGDATFGTRFAMNDLPSLPVGARLATRAAAPRPANGPAVSLCVIGAPRPSEAVQHRWPALAPLSLDSEQRRRLIHPFEPEHVRVWLGDDATRARLRRPEVESAALLHVVAHGCFRSELALPAGLLLSPDRPDDDGIVGCEEILRLSVPPIVALSCCGAARGQERRGEDGLTHLGGAFLVAGASCVVLSRFQLEYSATLELVAAFQTRLAAGDAAAEALRAARATLHQDDRRRHPFFHSLLRVYGVDPIEAR